MRAAIYQPAPTQFRYLVDKVIIWEDSSTEHVQVDQDGNIHLNGMRKRLVGFHLGSNFVSGSFSDLANLTILHTELDYLMAKGIRIIEVDCWYCGLNAENTWNTTLDLLYQHKMLVLMGVTHRQDYPLLFDSLSTVNFSLGSETVSQQIPKWVDNALRYSNVIAISSESEPELPIGAQAYTVPLFVSYLQLVNSIIAGKTSLPIIVKQNPYLWAWMTGVQANFDYKMRDAILSYSAIPCADIYSDSVTNFGNICNIVHNWSLSRNQQIWITEMNFMSGGVYNSTLLAKAMIDAMLARNASVVFLFAMNFYATAGVSFFNTATGDALANTDILLGAGTPGANVIIWQAQW